MQVLLIHQSFALPRDAGGTRHFELFGKAIQHGHRFTVITSDISYLTASRQLAYPKDETVAGIRVLRVFTYRARRNFIGRLFGFISFALSAFARGLAVGDVDVVMGTSPPIFQAASAWLIAALRRRPFLLEIRDLWPEFIINMGKLKNPLAIRLSRWLEKFLYQRATHLLVNSPAYVDYLINKGVASEKITLIPNGVDPAMFDPKTDGREIRSQFGLDGKFVIVYAGAISLANDVGLLLDAAARLDDDGRIRFLIVGDGNERERLEQSVSQRQLKNVIFTGAKPKQEMADFLASADACVAVLQNIEMFRLTYPNKVFDYLAAGRPVLLAIDGVIREVVETAQAGIFIKPGNAEALADAARFLCEHESERQAMGERGRAYVEKYFNRDDQGRAFIDLIEKVSRKN
ncbi:MAG: glycosyltransferase family 4 protein [Acidobacteriota bacterium]